MLELREYHSDDLGAVRRLLDAEVFSDAQWAWEAEGNPSGRRVTLAIDNGRVLALAAARPMRMLFRGELKTFTLGLNVCVDRSQGDGPANAILGIRAARKLMADATTTHGDLAMYGWPSHAEWRASKRLLATQSVRTQSALVCALDPKSSVGAEVEVIERYDHQASWLFDRCCGGWGIAAMRDADFLNWRFVDHPTHSYQCLGVRDDEGILRGTAVVRVTEWLGEMRAVLVEWLVPEDEPAVASRLVQGAGALAVANGASSLAISVPDWSGWFALLQEQGFRVVDTGEILVARSFVKFMDDLWLRAYWWQTLADSALV